jgi:hypothetical protein
MNYCITYFQKRLLRWIAKKIVIQSHCHKDNIIAYYEILVEAARKQFNEDNKPTLDCFLVECHQKALKNK